MHPQWLAVVLDKTGKFVHSESFYNRFRAEQAVRKAHRPDRNGRQMLHDELGTGRVHCAGMIVKLKDLNQLGTRLRPDRASFLNLLAEEAAELAARLEVPQDVVVRLAYEEQACAEGKRGFRHFYALRTEALMRRCLPAFMLRILIPAW